MNFRLAAPISILLTTENDWYDLKNVRLSALLDAPTAFGVSHQTASGYTDRQWQERAAGSNPSFWLASVGRETAGMIGGALSSKGRYNLIAMWVAPQARGSGIAARLVDTVKAGAAALGHGEVFLDVAPDNRRAVRFYEKQGFAFIDEWEALASHPQIRVQTMAWRA